MKKINLKWLNWAAWLTLFFTYILPYRETDGFETSYGYPIPFIYIHDVPLAKSPLLSMSVTVGALIIDVFILYFVIIVVMKIWNHFKMGKEK